MLTFSMPNLNSYSFLRFLCASLAMEKKVIIDKAKFTETIYEFKQQAESEIMFIFDDIEFRSGINSLVSYDINEGITNLQTLGVIGKLNPTYEKILIYLSEQDAEEILKDCNPVIKKAMQRLANMFER